MSFLSRLWGDKNEAGERGAPTRPAPAIVTPPARQKQRQEPQPAVFGDMRTPTELKTAEQLPADSRQIDGVVPKSYAEQACVIRTTQNGTELYFLLLSGQSILSNSRMLNIIRTQFSDAYKQRFTREFWADGLLYKEIVEKRLAVQQKTAVAKAQQVAVEKKTSAVRYFEGVVAIAIRQGATDVHFELRALGTSVIRMRISGIMEHWKDVEFEDAKDAVGAAYTTLATENTRSESTFNVGMMQSCSIDMPYSAELLYRLRYQSTPCLGGFDVIIRLLKIELGAGKQREISLEDLGFSPYHARQLDMARRRNSGAIIISGVTGSGKSTTLKALMTRGGEHQRKRKNFSVEDPVEYKMPGVTQVSVQRSARGGDDAPNGNPFTAAIRMVLRGDPDTLMVGEIRDAESASLCSQMVLSGHQIMSTVHAGSAPAILTRLASQEVGVPRDMLALEGFLSILVYQKLIPVTCPHCALPAKGNMPDKAIEIIKRAFKSTLTEELADVSRLKVINPGGCDHCGGRGVRGQTVVAETIIPDETFLGFVREGADAKASAYWRSTRVAEFDHPDMQGKTAFEHGVYKMLQGLIDPTVLEDAFEPFELRVKPGDGDEF